MITKNRLLSIISKYHLGGLIEGVIWNIKDNNLNIKFNSPSKEMLGKISFENIPLEDAILPISNTTQLNKLTSVTNNNLNVTYVKNTKSITKLVIADEQYTVNYALADSIIIPKSGEYSGEEIYEIESPITTDIVNSIIKAKSALPDSEVVVIKPQMGFESNKLELEFGGDVEHANKISFFIDNTKIEDGVFEFKENYNSNIIKEILSANKDMVHGRICINLQGIMKIEFNGDEMSSTYYLVSNS